MQGRVQPGLHHVPVAVESAPDQVPANPVHAPEPTPVPTTHTASIPCPATCSAQPPAPAATPRRSARAGRGTTSKYDDYVQPLQASAVVGVDRLSAVQLVPPIYYTEPTYYEEPPAGMYNKEYPYDLVIFRSPSPSQPVHSIQHLSSTSVRRSGILETPSTTHGQNLSLHEESSSSLPAPRHNQA